MKSERNFFEKVYKDKQKLSIKFFVYIFYKNSNNKILPLSNQY